MNKTVFSAQEHEEFHVVSFSDPEQTFDMPDDWKEQSIQYGDWAKDADVAVSLDQHLYVAYKDIIEEYARKNGLKIALREGSCGISAGALYKKAVDIGGFCCPPGNTDRLPGLQYHTVGIGSLALLVHPDNPVDNVTLEQAREIYMGRIRKWSKVSTEWQKESAIHTVARLHCKQRPGHWRLLLDTEDQFGLNLTDVGTIQDVITQAATDRFAIAGAETLYMANRYKQDRDLKPLNIDGFSPKNPEHLIAGDYPLYFTYNLAIWENQNNYNKEAVKLIQYIMKNVGNVDGKYGIVPAYLLNNAGWKFRGSELVGEPE